MLQKLRDKTSGWIAMVVLGLLCIPFAFFGMEQYLFQQNQTFAAKVEAPPKWWQSAPSWWPVTMLWQREEIDQNEFRNAFEQARQQARTTQGDSFDPRQFESVENKLDVLDGLVDQAVMRMSASRAGIAVSDAQVRDVIQSIPAFQVDGKFDPQRYQLALASQVPAMSPRGFEQTVREGLKQTLVPSQVAASAFVTKAQLDRLMKLIGERRDVSFVVLPPPAEDTAPVSDAEVGKWYEAHKSGYRAPETVAIEYVDIDSQSLPEPPAADEAALRERYEQEKARFVDPEQRLASHILIQVDPGADAAAQKAAEEKAARIAEEARKPGADFAELARENSDDAGSKQDGGDLGWVAHDGGMVKPFEDALFAMKAGDVSEPVKSEFGWHVIQLREVRSGKQVTFEEARPDLEREQAEVDRERSFNELTGKLVDQVLKNPSALVPAARAVGLEVQKLGPFARGQGTGVASNPAVERAAFSELLIQDRTVSDPVEIAPGHSVVLRVIDHTAERALSLDEVKDRVVAEIRGDRMRKALEADADAMVAKLKAGQSLSELASARDLAAQDVPNVPRNAPVPHPAATEAYFEVPVPAEGKVSPGKVILDNGGGAVVFAVTKVTPGKPEEASEQERTVLQQQLAQVAGNEDAQGMLKSLRKRMKITVAESRL
ncbi:MAG TPA: SurA N-terminal domain-containing protein [Luteimonas sp.]|nr:SurA N-terminal domain-containing protein [Luteimonas sp.]